MGILRPLLPHFRGGSRYAGRASYSCISSMSSRTVEPWGSLPILSTLHNKKSALRRISFVMERVMGILRLLLPHFRGGRSSRTRVLLLYFPRCLHGRSNPWGSLPILSTLHNKKSALRRTFLNWSGWWEYSGHFRHTSVVALAMPDARADSYFLEALQRGRALGVRFPSFLRSITKKAPCGALFLIGAGDGNTPAASATLSWWLSFMPDARPTPVFSSMSSRTVEPLGFASHPFYAP